jgi:WD40 repeat protein
MTDKSMQDSLDGVAYQVNALDRIDAIQCANEKMAIVASKMEGPVWDGAIYIVDDKYNRICMQRYQCGIADVAWCGVDRNRLALACDNGDVVLYSIAEEDGMQYLESHGGLMEHDDAVVSLSTPESNGNLIASASWDHSIKIWDLGSGSNNSVGALIGHRTQVCAVKFNSRQVHVLASGSRDNSLRLWDQRNYAPTAMIKTTTPPLTIDWDPVSDTRLAAGFEDGTVVVYDIRYTDGILAKYNRHAGCVYKLAFSPDGSSLASASDDCTVHVCELERGSDASSQSTGTPEPEFVEHSGALTNKGVYNGHSDYVRGLVWGRTGGITSSSWDGTVQAWEPASLSA